jgi:hypothetical protein
MCWKEKIQWQCYPRASERACVTFSSLFGQGKIILHVTPIMQCVAVIIQLVLRDHVCRFENGSQMVE